MHRAPNPPLFEFRTVERSRGCREGFKKYLNAENVDAASAALEAFCEKWDKKYPAIGSSWRRNWERIIPFLDYPQPIRKMIYTTNAIESLHMVLRKIIKNRGHFRAMRLRANCST